MEDSRGRSRRGRGQSDHRGRQRDSKNYRRSDGGTGRGRGRGQGKVRMFQITQKCLKIRQNSMNGAAASHIVSQMNGCPIDRYPTESCDALCKMLSV